MQPFNISAHFAKFNDIYPTAKDIVRLSAAGGDAARVAIARLWMSEGIPFAFRHMPALYEQIRAWLAVRLAVDPKEITLVGSARIGQSLSADRLGAPFSNQSDLDFTTVSSALFERLRAEFNAWAVAYETDAISPKNTRERRFWDDNLARGPNVLERGFFDSRMIPLLDPYPVARGISQSMYLLRRKLEVTIGAPQVRDADLRAYRDWNAYARQMARSLAQLREPPS